MRQPNRKVGKRICAAKRAKGNVYLSELTAELAAARMSLQRKDKIKAYKCQHCSHWHIGGDRHYCGNISSFTLR